MLTIDILCLIFVDLANSQFTIGCLGSAVTTREIVNHQTHDALAGDVVCKFRLQLLNVRDGIAAI